MLLDLVLILALSVILILIIACSVALILVCIRRRQNRLSTKSTNLSCDYNNKVDGHSAEREYFLNEIPLMNKANDSEPDPIPVTSWKNQSFVEPSDEVFNPTTVASLRYSNRRRASYRSSTKVAQPAEALPDRRLSYGRKPVELNTTNQVQLNRRSSFGGSGIAPLIHTTDEACLYDRRSSLESTTGRGASFCIRNISDRRSSLGNNAVRRAAFNFGNECDTSRRHTLGSAGRRSAFNSSSLMEAALVHNPKTNMSRHSSMNHSTRPQVISSNILSSVNLSSTSRPFTNGFSTNLQRRSSYGGPANRRSSLDSTSRINVGQAMFNSIASPSNDENIIAITSALNDVRKISVEIDRLRDHMRGGPLPYASEGKKSMRTSMLPSTNTQLKHSVSFTSNPHDDFLNEVFI